MVAIGGSNSKHPLQIAVGLAKEQSAALRAVHVVDLVAFGFETPDRQCEYEAAVRKSGAEVLEHALAIAHLVRIEISTKLLELRRMNECIADAIACQATLDRTELIVIGTHSRRGVARWFHGGVAQSLIRVTRTPLVLVPDD